MNYKAELQKISPPWKKLNLKSSRTGVPSKVASVCTYLLLNSNYYSAVIILHSCAKCCDCWKNRKKSSVVFSSPAIRNLRAYTEKTEDINVSKKTNSAHYRKYNSILLLLILPGPTWDLLLTEQSTKKRVRCIQNDIFSSPDVIMSLHQWGAGRGRGERAQCRRGWLPHQRRRHLRKLKRTHVQARTHRNQSNSKDTQDKKRDKQRQNNPANN